VPRHATYQRLTDREWVVRCAAPYRLHLPRGIHGRRVPQRTREFLEEEDGSWRGMLHNPDGRAALNRALAPATGIHSTSAARSPTANRAASQSLDVPPVLAERWSHTFMDSGTPKKMRQAGVRSS